MQAFDINGIIITCFSFNLFNSLIIIYTVEHLHLILKIAIEIRIALHFILIESNFTFQTISISDIFILDNDKKSQKCLSVHYFG